MVVHPESAASSRPEGAPQTSAERERILATLSASWPQSSEGGTRSAIGRELERFASSRGSSLPFFASEAVLWVTVAPSFTALHREIQLLRAWVIPSYAWDDPKQPFIAPGDRGGRLSNDILAVSPSGYFRWRCSLVDFAAVAARLKSMRELLSRRPEHVHNRIPSLLELRQQFRIALVTGARESAEAAVRAIDHYQLDSAVNTQLMRVRFLDQFGEHRAIVEDPVLEQLLGLRLPHAIRVAIARAFHAVYLAPLDAEGAENAARAYAEHVHAVIGGMLAVMAATDATEVEHLLGYRAWMNSDAEAAAALLSTATGSLGLLLRTVVASGGRGATSQSLIDAFHDAIRRGDLRAIQGLAPSVLRGLDAASAAGREVSEAVRETLEDLPNAAIAEALAGLAIDGGAPPSMPQSWRQMLQRIREGDVEGVERFLALDYGERPVPDDLSAADRGDVVAALEELLTDPALSSRPEVRWVVEAALPAFVEDFVSEPGFPRLELASLYEHLFRLWLTHRAGSAYGPDSQVLIMLAQATLERSPEFEQEATQGLIDWWRARPVPAALPFLLEALDVVLGLTRAEAAGQQLWLDGATLFSRHQDDFSLTERALWRRLGRRAGFDDATTAEVLPLPLADQLGAVELDPVAHSGLRTIAIVSLHRRAAEEAREVIAERSGATVFVVDETVAGPATRRAQSADAILFVWAATKHAVFRAFDGARDRVVYVQGSGAGSIILALERWLARDRPPVGIRPTPERE